MLAAAARVPRVTALLVHVGVDEGIGRHEIDRPFDPLVVAPPMARAKLRRSTVCPHPRCRSSSTSPRAKTRDREQTDGTFLADDDSGNCAQLDGARARHTSSDSLYADVGHGTVDAIGAQIEACVPDGVIVWHAHGDVHAVC